MLASSSFKRAITSLRPIISRFNSSDASAPTRRPSATSGPNPARLTLSIMDKSNLRNYGECLAVAARMKDGGLAPNVATYNALMYAAAHHGAWLDAWAIMDDMVLCGIPPTVSIFNNLIYSQRHRNTAYLWKVIDRMNESNITPDVVTFALVIERFAAAGNLEMALQYFSQMKAQKLVPSPKVMQNLIILAAQQGYPKLAIDLAKWFEMASVLSLESASWLHCLISSADNIYKEGILESWDKVVGQLDILPDEGVCISVLHAAARLGLPDLVTDVLRVLNLLRVPWAEHHLAPLIEAFCNNNQIQEAVQSLAVIRRNNVAPTLDTARSLLEYAQANIEALDALSSAVDSLHQQGRPVDPTAFKILIAASISCRDLQRAIGTYQSLSDYKAEADLDVFNMLLAGCASTSQREIADLLLADMKQANVKPDQTTYHQMISLCLTQPTYEDAFYYLEEMKAAGYRPSRSTYESIIKMCLGNKDERYQVALHEMQSLGYKPTSALKAALDSHHTINAQTSQKHLDREGAAQRFLEVGGLNQGPGDLL